MTTETTLAEVLSAIEDIELTRRFHDYRVDPCDPLVPIRRTRVLREGYEYRFSHPYLDLEAFPHNPLPDFMAEAVLRLGSALKAFAYAPLQPGEFPHANPKARWKIRLEQASQLRAKGYETFLAGYVEEFDSELLTMSTKYGLLWIPISSIEQWEQEHNQAMTRALDSASESDPAASASDG